MSNSYLANPYEIDHQVFSTTLEQHGRELGVVDTALDHIIQGLNDLSDLSQRLNGELDNVRIALVVTSFNSLRMAMQALGIGHYQQAFALARMAAEAHLVAQDAKYPPTLTALTRKGEGRVGRGDLALEQMAGRRSDKTRDVWKDRYGFLSKFGAHPRHESLVALLRSGPDGKPLLSLGGEYDAVLVNGVLSEVLRELMNMFAIVAEITHAAGSDWVDRALSALKNVDALFFEIGDWANNHPSE